MKKENFQKRWCPIRGKRVWWETGLNKDKPETKKGRGLKT